MNAHSMQGAWRAGVGLVLMALASLTHAQVAGEVEFARGVGFAQTPGQGARITPSWRRLRTAVRSRHPDLRATG